MIENLRIRKGTIKVPLNLDEIDLITLKTLHVIEHLTILLIILIMNIEKYSNYYADIHSYLNRRLTKDDEISKSIFSKLLNAMQ